MQTPFKFLDAYTLNDKEYFFGREKEVAALYKMVNQNRLILVYGQSGTGKTSLVQCGLASQFESVDWYPLFIRRGEDINQSFKDILKKALKDDLFETLPETIEELYALYVRPIYLLFDQFEELFILGTPEEQSIFFQHIAAIVEAKIPCRIIFIMREEYLAHLYDFERFIPSLLDRRLRVEPMSYKNVREVLEQSFRSFNIRLENAKENTQKIIQNLSAGGGVIHLPYLQVYLDMLYREDFRRTYQDQVPKESFPPLTITTTDIDRFGRIEDVLDKFLEEQSLDLQLQLKNQYPSFPSNGVFRMLNLFVTEEGTKRPIPYIRQEELIELPAYIEDAIPDLDTAMISSGLLELEKSRLLRFSDDAIELSHDTLAILIDLKRTDEERQLNAFQRQLKTAYSAFDRTKEYLSAKQLAVYEDYIPKLQLEKEVLDFIQTSKKDAAQKEAEEKERQQREFNLIEQKLETEKKASRRQRRFSLLILFVAVVAVIVGFWANNQRVLADESSQRAKHFISYLEAKEEDYTPNGALIGHLTNILSINSQDNSELTEYTYNLRADLAKQEGLLENAMGDYDWLIRNGRKEVILSYFNYLQETARIANENGAKIPIDSIQRVYNDLILSVAGEGYLRIRENIVTLERDDNKVKNYPKDADGRSAKYLVYLASDTTLKMPLYQEGNNYYCPGRNPLDSFDFSSLSTLEDSGLPPELLNSRIIPDLFLQEEVPRNLDYLSTSLEDFVKIGLQGYNLGRGNNKSTLAAFNKGISLTTPKKYGNYFGEYGLGITKNTDDRSGYMVIDGQTIDTRVSKLRLKSPAYLFLYWRALQDPLIQRQMVIMAIKKLIEDKFTFLNELQVYGYFLIDLVTSEAGLFHLLTNYPSPPKEFSNNINEAFRATFKVIKKLPPYWNSKDESLFLKQLAKISGKSFALNPTYNASRNSFSFIKELIKDKNHNFYTLNGQEPTNIRLPEELDRKKEEYLIFLEPGHGGINRQGKYTTAPSKLFNHEQGTFHDSTRIYEGVLNRSIVYKVARKLVSLGIPHVVVCPGAEDLSLEHRSEIVNFYSQTLRNKDKSIYIRSDFNGSGEPYLARGFEIYTTPGKSPADELADLHWENVKALVGNRIKYRSDRSDGDHDKEGRFYTIRKALMPAIHIEHLFFTNYEDALLAMDPEIIESFAEAQVKTIVDWIQQN